MFQKLTQFEFDYQLKQRAFALLSLLFLLMGLQIGRQGYGRGTGIYNSSQSISEITAILTLGSVFIIMFFTINSVLRDSRFRMEPIMFSTPVKKHQYFWSQFIGVFMSSSLAFCAFLLGFAITTMLPNLDPEFVNPFRIADYLWTVLIIVLPNIFICTAIIFSVSILSKNNVATYASAILIYVLYFLCSLFLNSPIMANSEPLSTDNYIMAALLDPFGLSAMFEQTQYWTQVQKNTLAIQFSGNFMWNRLLWTSVGILVLSATYALFSFRKSSQKVKKQTVISSEKKQLATYTTVESSTSVTRHLKAFIALFFMELKNAVRSLPFIGVLLLWMVIIVVEIASRIIEGGQYNDSLYPVTYKLIELYRAPLYVLGYVLLVFYSGEIVWRERSLEFSGIIDSTPTKNGAFFLSKLLSLLTLPFMLIAVAIGMSVLLQVVFDYHKHNFSLFASLFYYPGMTFVIYAMIAVFVQSIVPNKFLGMGITGLVIVFFGTQFSSSIGIEHPMLLIGNLPEVEYTGMNGFEGIMKGFHYLSAYWFLFAVVLSFFSYKLWRRGVGGSLRFRLKVARANWNGKTTVGFSSVLLLFIAVGTAVFYNTNIEAEYRTTEANLDARETYELKYKKYEDLDGLFPIKMRTEVDLYPTKKKFEVRADYVLKHKGSAPLKRVLITEREKILEVWLEGGKLMESDEELGVYLFEFEEALKPGDSLKYGYALRKELKGFETDRTLVANGTYIQQRSFEPALGYISSYEISNALERETRGLPERLEDEVSEDHMEHAQSSVGRVYFETVVSTGSNQRAISSGELVKEWSEAGRNYFHYKHDQLLMPMLGYFSADYEEKISEYKGISVEQFYHAENDYNIERIQDITEKTLDYMTANFGSYPHNHIRIAQIPSHWPFGGFAHPGTISMTEDKLYLVDLRDSLDFDLVAKRTIHEVAHQWFGHILAPKPVEGGSMFLEGFAKYSEAIVMENLYGKSAVWELSRNANKRYFTWRAYDSEVEPPLYQVNGQGYLSYGKFYTAMLALRDLVGEGEFNKVIAKISDKYRDQMELEVTTLEFLYELYAITPSKDHKLIDDWFKRIVLYDLAIENVAVTSLDNGKYKVEIDLETKRFKTLEDGSVVEIEIDELIKVGVFTKHPRSFRKGETPLFLENKQLSQAKTKMSIIVDEKPEYVSIDPYGTRSDENYSDNTFKIEY